MENWSGRSFDPSLEKADSSMSDEVDAISRQWLERAREDLSAARQLNGLPAISAFHSQQAVEKSIKAVLVMHQVDFPKSHDIRMLLNLLAETGTEPEEQESAGLESLTQFAVETRYPPDVVHEEDAKEALDSAERLLAWAERVIPRAP